VLSGFVDERFEILPAVTEDYCPHGCDTMQSDKYLPTFRGTMLPKYSEANTKHSFPFLKVEAVSASEASVKLTGLFSVIFQMKVSFKLDPVSQKGRV
jgi:hypothetical protein